MKSNKKKCVTENRERGNNFKTLDLADVHIKKSSLTENLFPDRMIKIIGKKEKILQRRSEDAEDKVPNLKEAWKEP